MIRVKRDAALPLLPTGKTLSELVEGFVTKIEGARFPVDVKLVALRLIGVGPATPRDVLTASCPPYPDAALTRGTPIATRETARANNQAAGRGWMPDVVAHP
jgi:hypothetical protein